MFGNQPNIYNHQYDFITDINMSYNNRLFATFTLKDDLDGLIFDISSKYDIIYKKIFVLTILNSAELVLTYNVESVNISGIPSQTILVHRKKESNSLYSLNALNELIKSLNNGKLDNLYQINWNDYRNSILLTQNGELKILNTKIYKIIEL